MIKQSLKDKVFTVLIRLGLAAAVMAFSVGLFGFLLPSLNHARGVKLSWQELRLKVEQQRPAIDQLWTDKTSFGNKALDVLGLLALIALLLWGLQRLFVLVCAALDHQGFWNRQIARRDSKHDE